MCRYIATFVIIIIKKKSFSDRVLVDKVVARVWVKWLERSLEIPSFSVIAAFLLLLFFFRQMNRISKRAFYIKGGL